MRGVVPASRATLAGEVRLIGVARLERGAGEILARAGQEAAEAQHALERLGAVADRGVEAAAGAAARQRPSSAASASTRAPRVGSRATAAADGGDRQARGASSRATRSSSAAAAVARLELGRAARARAGPGRARRDPRGGRAARSAAARAPPRPRRGGSGCPAAPLPGALVHGHRPGVRPGHERAPARRARSGPSRRRAARRCARRPRPRPAPTGSRSAPSRRAAPTVSGPRQIALQQRQPDVVAGDEREERGVEAVERAAVGAEQPCRCP